MPKDGENNYATSANLTNVQVSKYKKTLQHLVNLRRSQFKDLRLRSVRKRRNGTALLLLDRRPKLSNEGKQHFQKDSIASFLR